MQKKKQYIKYKNTAKQEIRTTSEATLSVQHTHYLYILCYTCTNRIYMYSFNDSYISTHVCIHTYVLPTHAYLHTYIHIHTYIYRHIYTST